MGRSLLGDVLDGVEFIEHDIEYAAIVIVASSIVPMLLEYLRHRRHDELGESLAVTSRT